MKWEHSVSTPASADTAPLQDSNRAAQSPASWKPHPLSGGSRLVSEVFLGRQPIYDGKREIQAYELLYRGAARDSTALIGDGDRASAEVMLKAFLEIGLQTISPSRPVFINYSEPLLGLDPIIPHDRSRAGDIGWRSTISSTPSATSRSCASRTT
jgi:hypothetical protein